MRKSILFLIGAIAVSVVTFGVTFGYGTRNDQAAETPVAESAGPFVEAKAQIVNCCSPSAKVRASCVTQLLPCGNGFVATADTQTFCADNGAYNGCCFEFAVTVDYEDANSNITQYDSFTRGGNSSCGQNDANFGNFYSDSSCFNNGSGTYSITISYLDPGCPCDYSNTATKAFATAFVTVN